MKAVALVTIFCGLCLATVGAVVAFRTAAYTDGRVGGAVVFVVGLIAVVAGSICWPITPRGKR